MEGVKKKNELVERRIGGMKDEVNILRETSRSADDAESERVCERDASRMESLLDTSNGHGLLSCPENHAQYDMEIKMCS